MATDFLQNIVNKMEQTKEELNIIVDEKNHEKVIKVNPDEIGNWEHRDRQEFELGNIAALAESIEKSGQAQPIIIVTADSIFKSIDSPSAKYIVIAGYRRWLACKSKNMKVDCIIRKLNFEQAVACLITENEKEKVSDYSKGVFYHSLLHKEKITRKALYERLNMNKGVFDNYLSFGEVPKEVWHAVGDLKNVSARTSAAIKLICQKGEPEKNAIIHIADKIAEGIGEKKISALVEEILNGYQPQNNLKVKFANNISLEIKRNSVKVTFKKLEVEKANSFQKLLEETINKFVSETA